jgi:hypothetical protein
VIEVGDSMHTSTGIVAVTKNNLAIAKEMTESGKAYKVNKAAYSKIETSRSWHRDNKKSRSLYRYLLLK